MNITPVDHDPREYPHQCLNHECGAPSYNSFADGFEGKSYCTNPRCHFFDTKTFGERPVADVLIEASNKIEEAKKQAMGSGVPVLTARQGEKAFGPKLIANEAQLLKEFGDPRIKAFTSDESLFENSQFSQRSVNEKLNALLGLSHEEQDARLALHYGMPADKPSKRQILEKYLETTEDVILPLLKEMGFNTRDGEPVGYGGHFHTVTGAVKTAVSRLKKEEEEEENPVQTLEVKGDHIHCNDAEKMAESLEKMRDDIMKGLAIPAALLQQGNYRATIPLTPASGLTFYFDQIYGKKRVNPDFYTKGKVSGAE